MNEQEQMKTGLEIAVIGMAGRFPGAGNIHEFRDNLIKGLESISFFKDEELEAVGVAPGMLANPHYVKANGILTGIDQFDASFFGYTPKEAEVMDPQMRIFHEEAWTALEDAGYNSLTYKGLIGLYAGAAANFAWQARSLLSGKTNEIGDFAAAQLTQKDYLSLLVSYKLNLTGPSFVLHSTCSTSLVAIHQACQSILNGECDMALAGGVTVTALSNEGYVYHDGSILSNDGHCRAFDASAAGMAGGDGVAVVVLKRLEDALAHRDHIYAVVKGSAVNNDGIRRAGFTAPSVEGQAEAIKMAHQVAEVEPASIGYIEAHGTATTLGDPVEIEGLKLAFNTGKKGFCAVGSVKSNMGHLDAAAGVTGFIKAVLALKYKSIPPSLHFETPNPKIDFIDSPFYINAACTVWEEGEFPRRAGASALGIGGTNAHVVLEEWPMEQGSDGIDKTGQCRLILLSAGTETALAQMIQNLACYLKENPGISLADTAYTLQVGRGTFKYRNMFPCSSVEEAVAMLSAAGPAALKPFAVQEENRPLIFIFPAEEEDGQKLYKAAAAELYRNEPVLAAKVNRYLENPRAAAFIFQYGLSRLLMKWGIKAYAMIGQGAGHYLAGCLSGELELEEGLKGAIAGEQLKDNGFSKNLDRYLKMRRPLFLYFGCAGENCPAPLKEPGVQRIDLVMNPDTGQSYFHDLISRLGKLWLTGTAIDWQQVYAAEQRYRIPLPTYPFQKQRYWIEEALVKAGVEVLGKTRGKSKEPLRDKDDKAGTDKGTSTRAMQAAYPRPELSCHYEAPGTPIEQALAAAWKSLFGFDKIGINDDFFELGGDSLKVITVVSKIQKKLDVLVPIPEFFDRPTIKELAGYILEKPAKEIYTAIEPAEEKEYYALTPAQRRVYILHQVDENNTSYNMFNTMMLEGEGLHRGMKETFGKLIDRHGAFRTSFDMIDNKPVQRVHRRMDFNIYYEKLIDGVQPVETRVRQAIEKFIRPFDLSRAPLLRVGLIEITPSSLVLLTDMHHIISDGYSSGIMLKEFVALYAGKDLSPLALRYVDYSQWLSGGNRQRSLAQQEEYWLKEFACDIPELELPLDYERPEVQSFEGDELDLIVDEKQTAGLQEIAAKHNITLFMVLTAVYNVFLAKLSGREDVVVGIGVAGRRYEELQKIIGMFVNTLGLRNYPSREKTFIAFLEEVKEKTLLAFENQDYPFEELVEKVLPGRKRNRNPLFDVVIVSGDIAVDAGDITDIPQNPSGQFNAKPYAYKNKVSNFDISLICKGTRNNKLYFILEYCTKLFKEETMLKFSTYFKEIIARVVENNDIKLKDIAISHCILHARAEQPVMELGF